MLVSNLHIDPSRTGMLRRQFEKDLASRVNELLKAIHAWFVSAGITTNVSQADQVEEFRKWLSLQVRDKLYSDDEEAWWDRYIGEAYRKGIQREYKHRPFDKPENVRDGLGRFAQTVQVLPAVRERVKLLAARTFTDLDGISKSVSQRLVRLLVDGLIQGTPVVSLLSQMHEGLQIDLRRSRAILSDTLVRIHAEAQLDAMETQGTTHVTRAAEWTTAGDRKVCSLCSALADTILPVQEARGLIPRHPNCRCVWSVARVVDTGSRKRIKRVRLALSHREP